MSVKHNYNLVHVKLTKDVCSILEIMVTGYLRGSGVTTQYWTTCISCKGIARPVKHTLMKGQG